MTYIEPIRPDELYHHGIKGQRWGIRRFQNEDGSYTAAGRKRYGIVGSKYIESRKEFLKRNYKISDPKAQKEAEKNWDTAKKVLVGAAIIGGIGLAAYAGPKMIRYGKAYADDIIRAGTQIKTVNLDPNRLEGGNIFVAKNAKDAKRYVGLHGEVKFMGTIPTGESKHQITATASKELKIAGRKTANAEFKNLMKTNPEFAQHVKTFDYKLKTVPGARRLGSAEKYKGFNMAAYVQQEDVDAKKAVEIFNESLKKKGYSGVADLNDRVYSGFNTEANILFDNSNLKNISSNKMDIKSVRRSSLTETGKVMLENYLPPTMMATSVGIIADKRSKDIYEYDSKYKRR